MNTFVVYHFKFTSFSLYFQSLASQRLTMVNRGAVKLLQAFVSQLPQQDLRHGLPSHFGELANLVRQVTLLSGGVTLDNSVKVKDKKLSPVETGLIAMVDQVEVCGLVWFLCVPNNLESILL